jgi:hypothetical protein
MKNIRIMWQLLAQTASAMFVAQFHTPVIETQPDIVVPYRDNNDFGVCLQVDNFRWGGLICRLNTFCSSSSMAV